MEHFEEIEPSQEYIDNFNKGYFIGEYLPELADSLLKTNEGKLQALKDGLSQSKNETLNNRLPDYLKNDPFTKKTDNHQDRSKGKALDKDDL